MIWIPAISIARTLRLRVMAVKHETLTNPPPVTGAIFGLSYVGHSGAGAGNNLGRAVVITANDGGAAWTPDEGNTWFTLPGVSGYWAVAFASPNAGWLVGTDGRILKISF